MLTLPLAFRLLRRDWRAGELRVLVAALVLAVGSVGTVGFFADRVKGGLSRQANLLLGADVMISGDRPLPASFADDARTAGLVTTPVIRFNSMVQPNARAGAEAVAVLTDVKAVGDGYPLRGAIKLADPARPEGTPTRRVPGRGEVWPDVRLAERLGLQVGDPLAIGEATLKVGAILQDEPEIARSMIALGPKLMLNVDDVPATNLLQPGNRATWRLLVAEPNGRATLDKYRNTVAAQLKAGQRIETVRDLRPEVRQALDRAEKFLGLAALVAVLLAAVAVALAASRYLRRHLDAAAMFRCFGASVRQTLALFFLQFLALGAAACAVGVVVALVGQQVLASLLGSVITADLPAPAWMPGIAAFCTGVLLLFGFALPPLIALARVPPLRVLRRDLPRPRAAGVLAYVLGAATIALMIGWQAGDVQTGLIMVGGVAALLVVAALAAWSLLALLKRLPQRGVTWRFGLANLRRRALASSLQIGALALGLMALLLLTVVRGDLLRDWRASLPPDAPNQFLINVLPEQVDDTRALLAKGIGADVTFRPMVRGRLVAVNAAAMDSNKFSDVQAQRLAEREFNLSWVDVLPKGNTVTKGVFWKPGVAEPDAGMSLEDGIAEKLGIKLDDVLTFDIAGTQVSARVTSLRKVDWDSFRVNFFALFPPGPLDALSATYIAAFHAPPGNSAWLPPLLRKNPNILAIDIGEIVRQVQGIADSVSRAIEFVFLFTLAGGLLVLQAAIAATQDERKFDAAILRTLGASQRQLVSAQVAEFLLLGSLAGLVAAGGATAIGWALATRVFKFPFEPSALVWVYGIVGGAVAVTLAGWFGTRGTARMPPLAVIRQLG
jgi:putative ABC transport system permease protein